MKILFVDTYYSKYLSSFRSKIPDVSGLTYFEYKKKLLSDCFGTSDFYSYNFRKMGWQADDIIINDEVLQNKWAKENGLSIKPKWVITKLQNLPYMYRFLGKPEWIQRIALAQILKYEPDIVYMQDLSILDPKSLLEVKKNSKLLVGQIASPMPSKEYLQCFDLIISSFPHFVNKFIKMGIKSEYQKLAFEPRIIKKVGKQKRIHDVSFVGSFTPRHAEGIKILEEVARQIPINVWGQGLEFLSPTSPLRKNYHGEAWGVDMYKILAQSKIVLNRHIGVSEDYANNMRLYEATGMGALLITDRKKNLKDLFKIGKEVAEYSSSEDLVSKVKHYLKSKKECSDIARSGQLHTIKNHSYCTRMAELSDILSKYV
jgi:hypothetical protein